MQYRVLVAKCSKGILLSEEVLKRMHFLGYDFHDSELNLSYLKRLESGVAADIPRHHPTLIQAIEDCDYFGINPMRNDCKWQIQQIDKPMYAINVMERSIGAGEFLSFPDQYHYYDATKEK